MSHMDFSNFTSPPQFQSISPEKLEFLKEMAKGEQGKTPNELFSSLSGISSAAQKKGISFDSGETSLIIEVLKQNMSEAERKKTDMILSFIKNKNVKR